MRSSVGRIALATLFAAAATSVSAQWPRYTTSDVPRLADGQPNLTAPAPRTPNTQRRRPLSDPEGGPRDTIE